MTSQGILPGTPIKATLIAVSVSVVTSNHAFRHLNVECNSALPNDDVRAAAISLLHLPPPLHHYPTLARKTMMSTP
jgi:hypothetical protein